MSSRRRREAKAERGASPKKRVPRTQVEVLAKTEGQHYYIKSIEDNDVIICDGKAGTGKAQPLDAVVYTINGPKKMGDIQLGDIVVTPNGESAPVIGIYPRGKLPVYKVSFSDGTSTEACGDHLWFTSTSLERNSKKSGKVRTTEEIRKSLLYRDKKNHQIPITNVVQFAHRKTPIDPYLLGVLIGDGHLRENATFFSSADDEIIQTISSTVESNLLVKKKSKYDYSIVAKKRGMRNGLTQHLRDLGLAGKKSFEKFVPEVYKHNSPTVRLEILQGIMDTDGSIDETGYIEYSTTSLELANDVQFLIESLGGTAKISSRETFYTYNGEKRTGRISYRLSVCMNPEVNPFQLSRKAGRVIAHTKYPPRRYITNVEPIGEKECQCILVDSDDHLYLTNNCIVTHNTLIAVGMAIKLLRDYPETYNRIIMVRPAVTVQGEDLGYLPGGIDEKMHPFIMPMLDSMRYFLDEGAMSSMMGNGALEIIPVAYMRGRTLNNTIVIFDEAQNSTTSQMKMFLTRLGFNSKAIIEGDVTQSDLAGEDKIHNGLADVMKRLDNVEGVAVVQLTADDIVRSPIVARILRHYD